jgi:hypothetical protein
MNLITRFFNAGRNFVFLKKNFRFLPVCLFAFFYSVIITAQEITTSTPDSSIIITKDARLDELISKQREQNIINPNMHGYRIQIYFGGVRQKASEVKLEFVSKFPDVPAYLSYQQPNFKVRVGDYRSRFEAQKFLKSIEGIFPTCFIVPDEVKLPPLK